MAPRYDTDYRDTFINGSGKHPYALPGMDCSVCKKTYGGGPVLPFHCPESFLANKLLRQGWPIPEQKHIQLQQALLHELANQGIHRTVLAPGAAFQPLHLKFGSYPASDFFWPTLRSVVISARTKRLFEKHSVSGVVFCPAVIDKVGKHRSVGPIPMPSTGEPEDIVEEAEPEHCPEEFGPLYEMVVVSASGRPPGAEVTTRCSTCGREEYDKTKRRPVLTENIICDSDVFFVSTTRHVIATDKIRDLVLRHRLTNVDFSRYDVVTEDSG